jgi:hypothetical protein
MWLVILYLGTILQLINGTSKEECLGQPGLSRPTPHSDFRADRIIFACALILLSVFLVQVYSEARR